MSYEKYFLLSLHRKELYEKFVRSLDETGDYRVLATAGTADWCESIGVGATTIEEAFDLAPRLDGQVKTLHPDLYTSLLATGEAREAGVDVAGVAIDLTSFGTAGEFQQKSVDIGGVSLLRAAVKNYQNVVPVSSQETARRLFEEYPPGLGLRRELASAALEQTLNYDAELHSEITPDSSSADFEPKLLRRSTELRYGENPHQEASVYSESGQLPLELICGDSLSHTNCLDLAAALEPLQKPGAAEVCVIKHTNPTGWARGDELSRVVANAWAGDPKSAYGGVMGLNTEVTEQAAEKISEFFLEVVVAPGFESAALEILESSGSPRLVECAHDAFQKPVPEWRSFGEHFLCQSREKPSEIFADWNVVSSQDVSETELKALKRMWRVCRGVTSNAAVVGFGDRVAGVGAGQQSRVDAVQLAVDKFKSHHSRSDSPLVLASDGFFPFPDNVEVAAAAGVDALVAPGGSIRDEEVVEAADKNGVGLVFAGRRIFSH